MFTYIMSVLLLSVFIYIWYSFCSLFSFDMLNKSNVILSYVNLIVWHYVAFLDYLAPQEWS